MGQTVAQKIIASHCDRDFVDVGEFVFCGYDYAMATDVTAALSIMELEKMSSGKLAEPDKVILVNDHFVPAKDINSASLSQTMRKFADKNKIKKYFEVGRSGICHLLLLDNKIVKPGQLLLGADSHTCTAGAVGTLGLGVGSTDLAAAWALGEIWLKVPHTIRFNLTGSLKQGVTGKDVILYILSEIGSTGADYKVMEYGGSGLKNLELSDRISLCNMAAEGGAKSSIIVPDKKTWNYFSLEPDSSLISDGESSYFEIHNIELSQIPPMVAMPYSPCNAVPVKELKNVKIDQVVIGSCTNGTLKDLEIAASVLKNNKVCSTVRLIILPGTQKIYREAAEKGILSVLVDSGALICPPSCGPCLGGHLGVLADGETALSTTNRNFRGRMGHVKSKVYLASPFTAAISAIRGKITTLEEQ